MNSARTGLRVMTQAPAHMIMKPVYVGDLTTAKGPDVASRPFFSSIAAVTVTMETKPMRNPTMVMPRPILKLESGENNIFSMSSCSVGYCTGRNEAATHAPCAGRKESPALLGKGLTSFATLDLFMPFGFDLDLDFVFRAVVAISNMLTCSVFFPFAGEANVLHCSGQGSQSHSDTQSVTARVAAFPHLRPAMADKTKDQQARTGRSVRMASLISEQGREGVMSLFAKFLQLQSMAAFVLLLLCLGSARGAAQQRGNVAKNLSQIFDPTTWKSYIVWLPRSTQPCDAELESRCLQPRGRGTHVCRSVLRSALSTAFGNQQRSLA